MSKIVSVRLFFLSILFLYAFSLSASSKNRFNVFVYSDYANISNLDSFYIKMSDSFMASILYTFNADSSGYYKNLYNLDLELFTMKVIKIYLLMKLYTL